MHISKKILCEGFTLIEMLITMLITSSVAASMFYFMNEINLHMQLEDNEFEVNNYANLMLDEIAYELRRSQSLFYETRLGRTDIQTTNSKLIVDLSNGFMKNDSLRPGFNPEELLYDGTKKIKYSLHNFKIEDVGFNLGDIYSQNAQQARGASRNIHLEILLFSKSNQLVPYDTLIYNRRVFCPGLLITESSS